MVGVALGALLSIVASFAVRHIGPFLTFGFEVFFAALVYGHVCDLRTGTYRWLIAYPIYITTRSPTRKIHCSLLFLVLYAWGLNGFLLLMFPVQTPLLLDIAASFLIFGLGGGFLLFFATISIPDSLPTEEEHTPSGLDNTNPINQTLIKTTLNDS